ncbi:MAG: hypothetical protein Q7V01_04000 [Vicinamibacterales bacterium]|nr:hypothetical protein [Vicinamibacterales bacterium]
MTISDEVMNDLLTVYLAGEASADTQALVEAHARQDQAFAARLTAARSWSLPSSPAGGPPPDRGLLALKRTREFIRLRTVFVASGVLFTLLPLTFAFDGNGIQFLILGRHPGLTWSFWSIAAASWTACYVMHREVRHAGL